MSLEQNPKCEQIPELSVGDKVRLKYFDNFYYDIDVLILSKNNDLFLGDVLDVINVQGAIVDELKANPISFDKTHVFLVEKSVEK